MLDSRRNLRIVPPEKDGHGFRRVHGRSIRMRGVLDFVESKPNGPKYCRIGRLVIPKVVASPLEFSLLFTIKKSGEALLHVANNAAVDRLQAGAHILSIAGTDIASYCSSRVEPLTLDTQGNFHYPSHSQGKDKDLKEGIDFLVMESGDVDLIDWTRKGIWLETEWSLTGLKLPSQRIPTENLRNQ